MADEKEFLESEVKRLTEKMKEEGTFKVFTTDNGYYAEFVGKNGIVGFDVQRKTPTDHKYKKVKSITKAMTRAYADYQAFTKFAEDNNHKMDEIFSSMMEKISPTMH